MTGVRHQKRPHRALSHASIPRYFQVASALRSRVKDKVWPLGSRIPTIEALEAEFGVARVTIRQAIEVLQKERVLEPRQGKGTFVIGGVGQDRWLQLGAGWQQLLAPIEANVPHILPVIEGTEGLGPVIDAHDGSAAPSYVYLKSLQKRDGIPYALARVYVARSLFDRAPNLFRRRVALSVLRRMKGLRIVGARQTLEIGAADLHTADVLGIPLNAAVAEAHIVVVGAGNVVLYVGDIIYRGDCLRISIDLGGDDEPH